MLTSKNKTKDDGKINELFDAGKIGTIPGPGGVLFPFPARFVPTGDVSINFRWWGRHTAHIGGKTIPSERWDNSDIQSLNVVAGYEVNIGDLITHDPHRIIELSEEERMEAEELEKSVDDDTVIHNKIANIREALKKSGINDDTIDDIFINSETAGDDYQKLLRNEEIDDQIDLKFRGNGHKDGKGGWYIPNMTFLKGNAQTGKEYPHPTTRHYDFQTGSRSFGSIVGTWIGFLAYCYNDKNGVPVNGLYINYKANRPADEPLRPEDYVFAGESRDTGNMQPGPILKKIAQTGGGRQSLQIRVDSAPRVYPNGVRRYFAVAIQPPE